MNCAETEGRGGRREGKGEGRKERERKRKERKMFIATYMGVLHRDRVGRCI